MLKKYPNLFLLLKHLFTVVGLYTLCRILFYSFNHSYFSELSVKQLVLLFFYALRFDFSVIVLSNSLFLILYLAPFKFREHIVYRSILKGVFITINSIAILANCVDLIYFKFTLKRTTANVFDFFSGKMGNDVSNLLPTFFKDYWYVIIIWMVFLWILSIFYKKIERKNTFIPWGHIEYGRERTVFFFSIGLAIVLYRGGFQLKPISTIDAGKYTNVKYIPLIISTPFSIIKTIDVPAIDPVIYFTDNEKLKQTYNPLHKSSKEGLFNKMNVFIIILESFSKEYIGTLNNKPIGYTPFLDSLIAESLTFTNAYSNSKTSIEGIPAIVAGMPTWMNEPYITSNYGSNQLNSLANLLKKEGYYTAFFHGGTNGTMGFDAFSNLVGYDDYFGRKEYNNEQDYDGNWGIWDEEFLNYVAKKVDKQPKPFFASVFTLSSHHPYAVPEKYKNLFTEGTLPIHKSVRYTDYALRRFFETIKNTTWYQNTLFVLAADHTSISDDAFYTNRIGNNAIPIIYFTGNHQLKGLNNMVTQQIDIMPSILDYLHYPKPYFSFGISVFDSTATHFAFTYHNEQYQLITNDYSLGFDGKKVTDLYNYAKDSLLQHDLKDKNSAIAKVMEAKTKALIQTYQQTLIHNKSRYED
jgi:phosphoglycerol transferase MdoB-like AlkP superfamily enzyme